MPKLLSACLAVAAIASTLSLSAHGNGTQAAPCLVTTDRGDVQGRDFCYLLRLPRRAVCRAHGRCQPMEATAAPCTLGACRGQRHHRLARVRTGPAAVRDSDRRRRLPVHEHLDTRPDARRAGAGPGLVPHRRVHQRVGQLRRHQRQATRRGARHRRGRAELPGRVARLPCARRPRHRGSRAPDVGQLRSARPAGRAAMGSRQRRAVRRRSRQRDHRRHLCRRRQRRVAARLSGERGTLPSRDRSKRLSDDKMDDAR